MKKKLNLVLREPVKLHNTAKEIAELPNPYKIPENKTLESEIKEITTNKPKFVVSENKKNETKNLLIEKQFEDLRQKMSPRVLQIWSYICKKAKQSGEIEKSFAVTRAEIMKAAEIGSTNTYRDALQKFQKLNLLEVELRPGVNSGSVFHLTKIGIEQIKQTDE